MHAELIREQSALTASWPASPDGLAAFSLRTGGISPPPWDSLNLSVSAGDTRENVAANTRRFAHSLGIGEDRIILCCQVHGNTIAVLDSPGVRQPLADAVIVARAGFFPAVKTADCLPVLLLAPQRRIAAAVHAGWRGTAQRITHKVIAVLRDRFQVNPQTLLAVLGPAIGPCCYEVDEPVVSALRNAVPHARECIVSHERPVPPPAPVTLGQRSGDGTVRHTRLTPQPISPASPSPSKFSVHLELANRLELLHAGVPSAQILSSGLCTACFSELFFSHRRDQGATGRHLALVGYRDR